MIDTETRLRQCFATVFPDLSLDGIRGATPESVEGWDSLANLSLITVIEEEFAIQIGSEDVDQLVSFETVLDYVRHKQLAAAASQEPAG
jgi:acyl carrier protein